MRILAIRGENLASLAGPFEILLAEPPLAGVGLFAITGPTGSGKSTLLDAMCLALFDEMPRFDGRGGALIGRPDEDVKARLQSHDVRSILRRGTGHGFAEVEYIGRGGARYRARWTVRRAREKAHGAFQAQDMMLVDVATGQSLGRTKTEVLNKIEETLGLTYEQFRRSALLAQGDFAAFLRAAEEQRSSLLEQMTGTELYTRLSIAAHDVYKEAKDEVARLEQEAGAAKVLPAEERARLEEQVGALERERKQAEETVARVEAAQRWFARRRELYRLEQEAIHTAEATRGALAEAAPLREELSQVERAHRVRPLLDAARAAEDALAKAIARRDELAEKARAASLGRDEAAARRAEREEALRRAREALEEAQPALTAAAALDAEVTETTRRLAGAAERARQGEEALAAAVQDAERIQSDLAAVTGRIDEVEAWMAANAVLGPLAAQWPRWEQELERYVAALREERAAEKDRPRLEGEHARALRQVEAVSATAKRAEEARLDAEARAREAEEAAHREALTEAMRAERDALFDRRERLSALDDRIQRAAREEETERTELAHAEGRRAQAAAATAAAATEEARGALLRAQHEEASRALRHARARQDLAGHRSALRDGEPCPLCGAPEHPYAKETALFADLLGEQELRVRDLHEELLASQRSSASRRAEAAAHAQRAEEAAARARRAREALDDIRMQWARAAEELRLAAPAPDAIGREVLQAEGAAIVSRLDAIKLIELRAAELDAEAKRRREAAAARREDEAEAKRALATAEKAVTEAVALVAKNAEQHGRSGTERERARRELSAPLSGFRPGWREEIDADARHFKTVCRDAVAEHERRAAQRGPLAAERAELAAKREAAMVLERERREGAQQLVRERAELEGALADLRVRRGGLLEGRPTTEVREALSAQVEARRTELEGARAMEQEEGERVARATAEAQMAAAEAAERAGAETTASEALAARLAEEGLERLALEAQLARGAAWMASTRAHLDALEQAAAAARAVQEERTRARAEHEGSGAPELTEEDAEAQAKEAVSARELAMQRHAEARAQLLSDDKARSEVSGKLKHLEERRAVARRWAEMEDLIGSADGKKFRIFAQSLTLDALLSYANEHLEELAPRYRLMRVPEHDLDLQILDQDMADEIRSVNSLSGGESFLVSLALALGLSSLSSRDVRVETLFVDEGLGSLDPETLEVAIASLDALQASGRQVGVISHVVALAEQIGTEIRVERLGGGRSRVLIAGASDPGPAPVVITPETSAPKKRTRKKA